MEFLCHTATAIPVKINSETNKQTNQPTTESPNLKKQGQKEPGLNAVVVVVVVVVVVWKRLPTGSGWARLLRPCLVVAPCCGCCGCCARCCCCCCCCCCCLVWFQWELGCGGVCDLLSLSWYVHTYVLFGREWGCAQLLGVCRTERWFQRVWEYYLSLIHI